MGQVRKRQRISGKPPTVSTVPPGSASDGLLDVDALDWKVVDLPGRLDDAEGFLGLEELDGVEVVRLSGADNPPRFKTAAKKKAAEAVLKTLKPSDTLELAGQEEWFGISDDHADKHPQLTPNTSVSANGHKREAAAANTSQKISAKSGHNENFPIKAKIDFTLLEGEQEDEVDVSAWASLELSPETLSGIAKLKFTHPTPIQAACIPEILAGHDVVGKASTGSGKTLAFGVPIVEYFLHTQSRSASRSNTSKSQSQKPLIALILSPTRELAHQLTKHLMGLNSGVLGDGLRIATVTGGLSVQKQQRQLADADVVVGTPGRLWEVLGQEQGLINRVKRVKYLIVDEADRLLSEGHFKEVEEILTELDRDIEPSSDSPVHPARTPFELRQTLVFSATFHKSLQQKLSGKSKFASQHDNLLTNQQSLEYLLQKLNFRSPKPKFIDVNPMSQMASNIQETLLECGAMEKDLYLYGLLLLHPPITRTLVFTNSISSVKRLVPLLQSMNLPAFPLHSSMPQKARLRSVERFSSASKPHATAPSSTSGSVLIATDVAARGLDIPNIDLILHYHVPRTADMYVHRSGRTARASYSGKSILLCSPAEVVPVQRLVAKVHATASTAAPHQPPPLKTLDLNRQLVSRLSPRVLLAQKIVATSLAKSKTSSDDSFLRAAADELGVDYSSASDIDERKGRGRGRGGGRKRKEREDAGVGKETVARWKAELKGLLGERVDGKGRGRLVSGEDAEELLKGVGGEAGHLGGMGEYLKW